MIRIAGLTLLLLLTAIPAAAQDEKKKDEPKKKKKGDRDPQSAIEPRSGPGVGQKFLEKFVGEYTVEKSFFRREGQAVKTTGKCVQKMIQNGRFLQSEFTFDQGATKSTGLGIIGFQPDSGKFTSTWIDSRSTRFSIRQSKEPFSGSEISLHGSGVAGDPAPTRQSRTSTTIEEDGKKIIHRQYSKTPEGTDRVIMELLMTRVSK